jgi:single-strand DNA-binding protein
MALPFISATGNLTQDIELNVTKSGKSVATIKIACNDRKYVNNQWVDGDVIYLTGIAWNSTAENAVATLSKGDTVTITGKLSQRSYTAKDGTEKTITEIQIDSLGAELRRTAFLKTGVQKELKTPQNTNDAWSVPLSDNSVGVNF